MAETMNPVGLAAVLLALQLLAQDRVPLLPPEQARADYSFAIAPGTPPLRFHVNVDSSSTITGVSVFRENAEQPSQTLPACNNDLTMQLDEYDRDRELLKHGDLNFDGFEDLELLIYFVPHLGKSVFCIFMWNQKAQQFRYEPGMPGDPVPHPDTKTITNHEDWFGCVWKDSTYHWIAPHKLELLEEHGRLYGSNNTKCGFTDFCSRLIDGKMRTIAEQPAVCEGEDEDKPRPPLACFPAAENH